MRAALLAMTVKTDRKDARGEAKVTNTEGRERSRPVCFSAGSLQIGWLAGRTSAAGRTKLLLNKLLDVEFSIRGILRGFGLKMGMVTGRHFEARIRELCASYSTLEQTCAAMLAARCALQTEYTKLHKAMLTIVRKDEVCRRLMITQGAVR